MAPVSGDLPLTAAVAIVSAPRRAAFEAINDVFRTTLTAREALDRRLREAGPMSSADRSLAAELTMGTLRRGLIYDRVIDALAHRPGAMQPELRNLLRMGVHQLVTMRVAAHAAVNTTVELANALEMRRVAPLVNAVLRRVADGETGPALPSRAGEPAAYLAARYALPPWLAQRFVAWFGLDEAEGVAAALLESPSLTLRVNVMRTTRAELMRAFAARGVECEAGVLSPVAVRVRGVANPAELPGFLEGHFSVQDEAAQLVALSVGARAGDNLLDACAAPGGKTTHLAEITGDRARILAVDVSAERMKRLEENLARLGITTVTEQALDAADFATRTEARFNGVLLDAPCSGIGVLRRHPEARYRLTGSDIDALSRKQFHLLTSLARVVDAGGSLVYAVCSFAPEEGAEHMLRFIEEYPEFTLEFPVADDALWHAAQRDEEAVAGASVRRAAGLTLMPHRHHTDGFFVARLRKRLRTASRNATA